jgi:hypothetical protein
MAERPLLNHQEMVIQPGEREHARAFFETMGFEVADMADGQHIAVRIDPEAGFTGDNVMYANEATPAQQKLEVALAQAIASDAQLADTVERYKRIRWKHPQYVAHFGASCPTHGDWKERVERLQEANRSHPLLKGRIDIKLSEPGLPDALGPLSQAFIHTDILACGPFALAGILFDLQWIPELDLENLPPIDFPDMATMV